MRQTTIVRVPEFPGTRDRDNGKVFKITEWPALRAERWLDEIALAATSSNERLPLDIAGVGWEGLTAFALNALILNSNADKQTLLRLQTELLECVERIRDPKYPDIVSKLVDGDIEEIATAKWLRVEVLSLHANFPIKDAFLAFWRRAMAPRPSPDLPTPSTSPRESTLSSEAA